MRNLVLAFMILAAMALTSSSQETVTVTTTKANLRGTPSMTGVIVTTAGAGETFELIKQKAPWYLVQTPKYVGWLHGSGISLNSTEDETAKDFEDQDDNSAPRTTTKAVSSGESVFQSEYVGGRLVALSIVNQTDRLLTLTFGGVRYIVASGGTRPIEVEPGRYEFSASVPRARPTGGVDEFLSGHRYSWRFFIVRR